MTDWTLTRTKEFTRYPAEYAKGWYEVYIRAVPIEYWEAYEYWDGHKWWGLRNVRQANDDWFNESFAGPTMWRPMDFDKLEWNKYPETWPKTNRLVWTRNINNNVAVAWSHKDSLWRDNKFFKDQAARIIGWADIEFSRYGDTEVIYQELVEQHG